MEFCRVYHEIKAPTNRQYGKPEITGKIVFTPDLQKGEVWTDNGVVVPALPITCDVIDGKMYDRNGEYPSRYANLMAGGPTANPNSMHWRVSYHDMRVGDEHFYIEPFIFKAIPYVKVNLADVTPVAGYTPPGIIRGGSGSPGLGIIFKGVVLTQGDLPVDGVENNHAYAITTTKDLAVWQDGEWLIIPNFANFDVSLEAISDLLYEARTNAEFSREQVVEMDRLRGLAEKYSQAARDAVELGRSYIRKMEDHVSESITAAGRAEELAAQAAEAAAEAVRILDELNPLRDDVDAAHAEVTRLHDEASQFTTQAAEHVLLASQHAADAQTYAQQALEHEAEGRRQATAALNSAEAAQGSAAEAQRILNDADAILSQVAGHSQDAKKALKDAEALLANADGEGTSLGDVLLEVAQKHQETLTAHNDMLDLHSEVLQKHSEAIRYVAMAASQASVAAQHAAQAAQEALNVAKDAARAAASAADAADEAAGAAENNRQAIGKLQEADGKLQEADQKLQDQINILEESQRTLARAVQLLAGAVAQAAAAAQHAAQAAEDAGEAVDAALDGIAVLEENQAVYADTQAIALAEHNDMIAQITAMQKQQAKDATKLINQIMSTKASSTWPGVNPFVSRTGFWGINLPDSKGALMHVEWLRDTGDEVVRVKEAMGYSTGGWGIESRDNEILKATWGSVSSAQVSIDLSSGSLTPAQSKWVSISSLQKSPSPSLRASQGFLTARVVWDSASRGDRYVVRITVNGSEVARTASNSLGPLTLFGNGTRSQTVTANNVTVPAGGVVRVQVYSNTILSGSRWISSASLKGTWIETA